MARRIPIVLLLLCSILSIQHDAFSNTDPDKSSNREDKPPVAKRTRAFKSLDFALPAVLPERDFFTEQYARPATLQESDTRQKIEATYDKVFKENRFIDFLDESALLDLPVGIKADLGVLVYTILIDSVVMTPTESFLYASMLFEIPESGKRIHFLGSDIKFSKNGGLTGDGKLMLVGDYAINLDGNNSQLIIKGAENKTFVEFDCSGYKQLSLDASLTFSRNLLEPEGANGEVAPTGNVAVNFTTTVSDWSDILIAVNVPKFRIKGVKDVTFAISDAVLDFSDSRNPASVSFPQGYSERSPLMVGGNLNLWRGVYIRELSVTLPPQFETKDPQNPQTPTGKPNRISFKGNNLILDNVGFSGKVSANSLIPIEKGKIGNWNFSLETIYISVNANEIAEAGFNGKVNIPLSKPVPASKDSKADDGKKLFTYKAVIKPGNEYVFTVTNSEKLEFDLWKAEVTINPSSYVEIKLAEGKFRPKACLNGQMTMNLGLKDDGEAVSDKSKNVKVAKVTFQGLEIQTIKPYVKVGSFSLGVEGGDSGMGGFPIQINGISGSSSANTITLGIDLTLALVGENKGGFAANGKFKIIAESVENGSDLSYRFKKIELERFAIDIDKGAFKFKGTLNFYKEDPIYGNGISGTVDATFEPTFKLQASAIFGTKNGMRYWFADALIKFESGVTIFPAVAFYSFGGGAYYHMKIDDQGVGSPLGRTVSGITYVPDETVGFGFKATISLGVQPGKQAFNAEATYEMAFNTNGGVRYINFRGNGYFMTPPIPASIANLQEKAAKLAAVAKKAGVGGGNLNEGSGADAAATEIYGSPAQAGEKAQVWASTMIHYDFDNHTLHGNLKAYVNVAGGLIKGAGPNGQAGEAVLHFGPGEWYIYIGRPEYENRFAIEVLGIARLDAYFVIGSIIPDSPPPPSNVSEILGGVDLDYMKDLNALPDGAGVGFGASFRVDTGDITFLMFYGRFAAGLGFDIMLKDYGDARCKGGGRLGINGWYANGQAYAYFEGTIGIKVKIWRKTKKINILDIGAAVVAQAKLPNPVWVRGIAGGKFSVLGGLVKGKCKFEIEIGKECEIIKDNDGSILETVEVLAQTTPQENAQLVDVFTVPQAIFNYEMEKEYEMVDEEENVVKFKISLDAFTVRAQGASVQSELVWNDDKTVAALNPFEILPAQQDLVMDAVVSFKEQKGGSWVVTTVGGEKLTKTYTVKFKTGEAPDYIPANNIAYSYPTQDQFNYYKNESSDGYIKLKQGQSYLFAKSNEWDQVVRFSPKAGQSTEAPFTYVTESKEVRVSLPGNLANNQVYQMNIVNVPKGFLSSVDSNVDTTRSKVISGDPAELAIKTRSAEGTLKEIEEKEIYTAHFRTSQYNTLRDKVLSVNPSSGWRDPVMIGVHAIGSNISGPEPFSYEEIYGSDRNAPLVQMEADLSNVPWYTNEVYPIVYQDYPINNMFHFRQVYNRDPAILGVIPTKGVYLYQYPYNFALTEEAKTSGAVAITPTVGRIDYYLAYHMFNDYMDVANQAANYVATHGTTPRLTRLITSTFPVIRKGDYGVNINYVLPGRNTITSTYRHKIYNPID